MFGRRPHVRFSNGNVRTLLWFNSGRRNVEARIEQVRRYSWWDKRRRITRYGVTRVLEASDFVHADQGLKAARSEILMIGRMPSKPELLSERVVLKAVERGDNPPSRTIVQGNIALLLWANRIDVFDLAWKVEIHNVVAPETTQFHFSASQIDDVRWCLGLAQSEMISSYAIQTAKWRQLHTAA
jgi:hypothetical protein